MLGIPEKDSDLFIKWIHEILELGIKDDASLMRAVHEMSGYFAVHIEQRKKHRTDDLISTLMDARDKNGQPFSDMHEVGTLRLLLIAGIDTTWSAIGSSLWHLAKTPADRERLVAEPELIPTAVEELLRAYSPVTMAREVMKDTVVSGCPVKAGNMVLLSFPAANRDPAMFADADKVVIDRKENRHAAFGLGIHRCVGSNLARMEMTVATEECLERIPDFRLDPAGPETWSEVTVRGTRRSAAARCGWWCRISISGRAQSGCRASNYALRMRRATGKSAAITTAAIPGPSSAIPAIDADLSPLPQGEVRFRASEKSG